MSIDKVNITQKLNWIPFFGISYQRLCGSIMKTIELLALQLEMWKHLASDLFFKYKHRLNEKCFVRKRKVGFREVLLIILNFKTKSNAQSAYEFATEIDNIDTFSRQAYEKARDNVKFTAFEEVYTEGIDLTLQVTDAKLFHGYRICAIDGSTVLLPESNELKKEYGETTPVEGKTYARVSLCVDVLNGIVLDGVIDAFSVGERKLAIRHINKDLCSNMLYLFDRGYWSIELSTLIEDTGRKFLFRLSSNAVSEVITNNELSGCFTVRFNNREYKFRFYKFILPSGEIEYLATNLSYDEAPDCELGNLYHLRWGVETKYNELKNRIKLEGFSGKSVNTIKQDFYASLAVMNMIAFAIARADIIVKEERIEKSNEHVYKPNGNMAVAILKNRLISAVIEQDPIKSAKMLDRLVKDISSHVIPIKPDRHFPRTTIARKQRTNRKPKAPL